MAGLVKIFSGQERVQVEKSLRCLIILFYFIFYHFSPFELRSSEEALIAWLIFISMYMWVISLHGSLCTKHIPGTFRSQRGFLIPPFKNQSLLSSSEPPVQPHFKAPVVGAGDVAQWLECILLFQAQFSAPGLGGSVTCNSCSKVSKASGLCGYYFHVHRHRYLLITENYNSKFFRTSLAKDFSYL